MSEQEVITQDAVGENTTNVAPTSESTYETKPILRTIDIKPKSANEAIKPAELIQMTGIQSLSLEARRLITLLYRAANVDGIQQDKEYVVEMDQLKPRTHRGYERVEKAILELMKTVVIVNLPSGQTRRVQLLGGNDMDDPDRPKGTLSYTFDRRLIEILEKSQIWGKLEVPVILGFTGKYSQPLYENIAQLSSLKWKKKHRYSLEEFRELLGVEPGKYKTFGELNKHVIGPAVAEVQALASFGITLVPIKKVRTVVSIEVSWYQKSIEELQEAYQELQKGKIGRRARISKNVERILAPSSPVENVNNGPKRGGDQFPF